MPAPPARAPSPPARPPSTAASAASPLGKPTGDRASTTSMPISLDGGPDKWRWEHGRRRAALPKVKVTVPDVKAKAEIKVQKRASSLRVPSTVIVTVEKTIRGGRDLVREGRRRFSRAVIAGEKRVRRATREGSSEEGVGRGEEECFVRGGVEGWKLPFRESPYCQHRE
ncbi:hypothetical protein V498_07059 [Pseudogymnoascus sp. VKM F-4517 (FW-2822)]|nr:hypothetical protein V498_07059 [Pseudogymnoascus sp. VKM F-4517 (FW-2822)]